MTIETPQSIISALELLLRPIVRMCIHYNVDHRNLLEMIKAAFVSVAKEEFKINGETRTVSRITLLTGVHRKDVRRLLGRVPKKINWQQGLIAQLITQWLGTPELIDQDGEPKPIPCHRQPDHKTSFFSLVERGYK